jgi:long-chain acyl-CoA synthetase
MNLFNSLEATVARWPEKNALIEDETVVTYADLLRRVNEFADQLCRLGVRPGNRIGLAFPNGIAYVALTYALWQCGAVVVPIPTECSPDEVAEIITAMELQGLVTPAARPNGVALTPDCFFVPLQPPTPPDNHGLNLAFIRFTSGTTSARKGVALSHETIRDRVRSANQAFGITAEDTVIWCLPMAHHFLITIVLYLEVGATIVLARHVTAKPFLDAVQRWQGTVLYAAPFHFAMLARDRSEAQISSVRLAVSTTCALPETVAADFLRRFQRPLAQALGVIELGLVAVNIAAAQTKWNSVGKAAGEFRIAPGPTGRGRLRGTGGARAGHVRCLCGAVAAARADPARWLVLHRRHRTI